jgi:hypothetical protein
MRTHLRLAADLQQCPRMSGKVTTLSRQVAL